MKKFIDALTELVKHHIAESIATLLLGLLVGLGLVLKTEFAAHIWPAISKDWLGRILAGTIVLLILETAYLSSLRKSRREWRERFHELGKLFAACGALWSKDLEPHCNACRIPLGSYGFDLRGNGPGCQCAKCDTVVRFTDENDRSIGLKEARKLAGARRLESQ